MFIDRINKNLVYFNSIGFKGKDSSFETKQTTKESTGIYPVYADVPYGIHKTPYVKLEEFILPTGNKACTYKLINGHTISVVQKDGCPTLKTSFKVGSLDEPDGKEGISHLIEHSIFHSSKNYEDIEQSIKDIGGYSNASTGYSKTNYYIKLGNFDKDTLQKAFDIQADMIFNPNFSKIDKEKKIVIKESQEYEVNEKNIIENQSIKNLLSLNKPTKDIISGNKDSIESISLDDMINYHKYFYTPDNSVTSIITPYNPDEIIKMISKSLLEATQDKENHPIERKNYAASDKINRNDIISKESNKKYTSFDFIIQNSTPQDFAKLYLLYEWFSKNPDFSFEWENVYDNNCKISVKYCGSDEDEYNAFENLKETFQKLQNGNIDNNELKKLKKITKNNFGKSYKEGDSITTNINTDYLNYGYYGLDKETKAIEAVTPKDLAEYTKLFNISKCTMNVIHPKGTTNEDLKTYLEKYKNYVTPIIIPKTTQNIDISNNLKEYNIFPYSSEKVLNTYLPDNTNLTLINSKTDDCSIQWLITNPDLSSYNPAAKFVLDNMLSGVFSNLREYSDKYGIDTNVLLSFDNEFSLTSDCKKENLNLAIEELKKALDILFNEKEFESSKQTAMKIIKEISNDETAYNKFCTEKWGQNLSLNKDDLYKGLEELTLNDVKTYFNSMLTNSYSSIVVKAPFVNNPELINNIASKANIPNFSFKQERELKNIYKPDAQKKCYHKTKNQPFYGNLYSFKINENQKDSITFDILAKILYQRLFNSLREEKGLAYSVNSFFDKNNDMGILNMGINTSYTDKEDVEKIFNEFNKQIEDLKTNPVTPKELKEAKNQFKMDKLSISETDSKILYEIQRATLLPSGLKHLENNAELTDSITEQDILSAAKYAFQNKPDYLIEVNQGTEEKNKDYFEKLC